jgi:hypothetical protein
MEVLECFAQRIVGRLAFDGLGVLDASGSTHMRIDLTRRGQCVRYLTTIKQKSRISRLPGTRSGRRSAPALDETGATEHFEAPGVGADKSVSIAARNLDAAILDQMSVQNLGYTRRPAGSSTLVGRLI